MKIFLLISVFYTKTKKNFKTEDFNFIKKNVTKKEDLIKQLGKGLEDEFLNNQNMFYKIIEGYFFKKKYIVKITFDEDEVINNIEFLEIKDTASVYIEHKKEENKNTEEEVFKEIKQILLEENGIEKD